jgi:cleavage and polyadenylation specificity factor subunit 1
MVEYVKGYICLTPSPQGPTLLEWMPDVDLNLGMPSRHIPQGRSYTNVVFEPTCGL